MTVVAAEPPVDVAAAWRRARGPLLVALLIVGAAVVLAAVTGAPPPRPLDPRDASPVGGRALAELLRGRAVAVEVVATPRELPVAGPDTTVLLPDPRAFTVDALRGLAATGADVVVVAPSGRELAALGAHARPSGAVTERTTMPDCGFDPAIVAGDARMAGPVYRAGPGTTTCYRVGDGASLVVQQRPGGGRIVVLGSAATLDNGHLDDRGDAALALGLLDDRPRLLWVAPQPPGATPADAQRKGVLRLLPDRLLWALVQVVVVIVLVALWRGRRLGPVVAEPLPVVVRAAETVEGRARLLRAAKARGSAAAALRGAAEARIRDLVGEGTDTTSAAVVDAVSRRTGRPGSAVADVLYGAAPADDAALVRLADDLDALERSLRDD